MDSDDLEWIELSADAKDDDPAQGGGAQTVPVMAKMVTILWDNVIADKDCYNVCSLWF